ncbi:hypothetical protein O6H91_Y137700 [Diphasiastrum complanatum]|nr:hypothetical protein O6H91_Y137700 [Diphasiastrum complanatum]KAJ7296202.1 hypothetical protein O6H91_Y137700 [Diphasiastrum complanatum]
MVVYEPPSGSTMTSQAPHRMLSGKQSHGQTKTHNMVPLILLLNREVRGAKLEIPNILTGQASQARKGEDFTFIKLDCQRRQGDEFSTFGVFAIFDGHNGVAAAIYSKENLLNDVMSAIPPGLGRDEWLVALPRALVAGFVKADKEFRKQGETSGTTVTFVVVDGLTVTVASVGDSRCILDSYDGVVSTLTEDHRLEVNEAERERVTASGGEVSRLSTVGGAEIGPLRCWPGGLCLSRSIGDTDVGEFIVPVPFVKQIKLPATGGRLILASDGVWDSLSSERAAKCCRGLTAELAARQIVKEALRTKGLRDDTTCLVVDVIAPVKFSVPADKKESGILKALKFRKRSQQLRTRPGTAHVDFGKVVELFEEGSARLSERLTSEPEIFGDQGLFNCAICQTNLSVSEGISLRAGSFFSVSASPWEGPFLCPSCKLKKDAMEGKLTLHGVEVA